MAFDPSKLAFYKTKASTLPGTHYRDVVKVSRGIFTNSLRHTKRKPYLRSAYFKTNTGKAKIFFDYFWLHMSQKPPKERYRRLKFFEAALEIITYSHFAPLSNQNPDKKSEMFHRFGGVTPNGEKFYIQIKEHLPSDTKQLMSIFPAK